MRGAESPRKKNGGLCPEEAEESQLEKKTQRGGQCPGVVALKKEFVTEGGGRTEVQKGNMFTMC